MHPATKNKDENKKPSGARAKVMRCEACAVNLCLNCWGIFHKKQSLKLCVFDILGEYDEDGLNLAPKRKRK
jgi:hypothetical protein